MSDDFRGGPFDAFSTIAPEQGTKEKSPHKVTVEKHKNKFELDCGKKVHIARPKEAI